MYASVKSNATSYLEPFKSLYGIDKLVPASACCRGPGVGVFNADTGMRRQANLAAGWWLTCQRSFWRPTPHFYQQSATL